MAARIVDQDAAHRARCESEEVRAVHEVVGSLTGELEIRLVNYGGGRQRVASRLRAEPSMREPAQLLVYHRKEAIEVESAALGLVGRGCTDRRDREPSHDRIAGRVGANVDPGREPSKTNAVVGQQCGVPERSLDLLVRLAGFLVSILAVANVASLLLMRAVAKAVRLETNRTLEEAIAMYRQ